jgi:hypothetical protein
MEAIADCNNGQALFDYFAQEKARQEAAGLTSPMGSGLHHPSYDLYLLALPH